MPTFDGFEIVRLIHDPDDDDLRTGDCGVVWGVYNVEPAMYEATFCNRDGQQVDLMFTEDEGELVTDFDLTPFPEHLRETQRILSAANEAIKQGARPSPNGDNHLHDGVAFARSVLNPPQR